MRRAGFWLALWAAAVAASVSGCASSGDANYSTPSTHQTSQAPPAAPPPQAAETGPIDPLVAEEERTSSPYKPVMKTTTASSPAKPQPVTPQSGAQE